MNALKIDCHKCQNHCCDRIPKLVPVLLPDEEEKFAAFSEKIKTPYQRISILKKNREGLCIFLDKKTKRCSRYEERPLECQLYPLLFDFSQDKPQLKIDERYCSSLDTLQFNKRELSRILSNLVLPEK